MDSLDILRQSAPTGLRSVVLRWAVAAVTATGVIVGSQPVLADALPKDDAARAMVLLLSLSQALAQKGGSAPAAAKPDTKPVPLVAAEPPPAVDGVAAAPDAAPAHAVTQGASVPDAQQ